MRRKFPFYRDKNLSKQYFLLYNIIYLTLSSQIELLKSALYSILLFLCLVIPIATTYIVLKKQQKKVKREVKWKLIEGIDRSELVLFKFTEQEKRTQLNWKHSKEFEYKGEMYDIAEKEVHGDTTYYWCWWDYEETALNKQLSQLFSFALGNSPVHKQNQEKIIQLYKSLYFVDENNEFIYSIENMTNCSFFKYQACFVNHIVSPDSPPPQFM